LSTIDQGVDGREAVVRHDAAGAYDVVVVGAGVVGGAVARMLGCRPGLRTALVDARQDVGDGTSKANTAILHTGFDASPGTLESRLVAAGFHRLTAYAQEVGIPVEPLGALLVAWTREELAALPGIAAKAERNGYRRARPVEAAELYAREPRLGPGALGALEIPDEGIVCTWTTTLALATQAVLAGVELMLGTRVTGVTPGGPGEPHQLEVERAGQVGAVRARYVVNAAGLGSDELDRRFGGESFTITPRRGQLMVFDKFARPLLDHVILPVPTAMGKGVLVAPTVYGNVMLGPTAENLEDKAATWSTSEGLDFLRDKGRRILPGLLDEEVTAVYAGMRAATEHGDYQVYADAGTRYVCVGGIRSTGLTAALALADHVRDLLADIGLPVEGEVAPPALTMPYIGEARDRPYRRADMIERDGAYGDIVCHCERVSRGEIRDALASPIPPRSIGGIRRRTRALMGRCQGFYCGAEVRQLLAGASS
jgi:glycerol-3-phosphate dehydrogenase